jgi:hypothetical protein
MKSTSPQHINSDLSIPGCSFSIIAFVTAFILSPFGFWPVKTRQAVLPHRVFKNNFGIGIILRGVFLQALYLFLLAV